jgi:hypothetical protein
MHLELSYWTKNNFGVLLFNDDEYLFPYPGIEFFKKIPLIHYQQSGMLLGFTKIEQLLN